MSLKLLQIPISHNQFSLWNNFERFRSILPQKFRLQKPHKGFFFSLQFDEHV